MPPYAAFYHHWVGAGVAGMRGTMGGTGAAVGGHGGQDVGQLYTYVRIGRPISGSGGRDVNAIFFFHMVA